MQAQEIEGSNRHRSRTRQTMARAEYRIRIVGTNPEKHTFSLPDVDVWTVLGLDLEE